MWPVLMRKGLIGLYVCVAYRDRDELAQGGAAAGDRDAQHGQDLDPTQHPTHRGR